VSDRSSTFFFLNKAMMHVLYDFYGLGSFVHETRIIEKKTVQSFCNLKLFFVSVFFSASLKKPTQFLLFSECYYLIPWQKSPLHFPSQWHTNSHKKNHVQNSKPSKSLVLKQTSNPNFVLKTVAVRKLLQQLDNNGVKYLIWKLFIVFEWN